MKIYLGTDHAGFQLKEKIKAFLLEKAFEVEDCGALTFDKDDDYPDFIAKTAIRVSENPNSKGVVFGKSGAGECIVANKIKGIRAILGFSSENVELSRFHNDANVLSLGSMFVDENLARKLVRIFLETQFTNEERHIRRINKIKELENNGIN
ncbi:MAG: ribose-5-phosphate isomerase [Candidatus Levybacteria bacterium RIFCSPLOWO2_01_FULL_39_24]|nr:MAG: ribose-5-phosphate isomerase [Candidatus Levybacteria bacterium RIFCSPHIGHO2_01_FULL_40_16]OGH27954.1 MAG: ribose-5-phosphate isomerase [Candidatus Levybacteria bacterium RIFCSPHIGHO2_12_FULL_39_9]OGH46761.1 MAG: ribose-5-phosphate isomerase [Candidatus Levybacteria bacterium RIFCSPLOWO2_01_FULL_39_24]